MPNSSLSSPQIAEDEIDLRALLSTLWCHKVFIILFTFFFTLITVVIAYRMPKYYKTTTVIEVKPKSDNKSGGLSLGSLGGAAALLGLGGIGGSSSSTAKDAAMLGMFRTNQQVLDAVDYNAQYFVTERFRPLELPESNCSIAITGLQIYSYKKFGMHVAFKPIDQTHFALLLPSNIPYMEKDLGTFSYDTPVKTPYFECAVHHKGIGVIPTLLVLNGDKRFIFNGIVSRNLTATVGGSKKSSADLPFVTISYLDTLPTRGEAYIRNLVAKYVRLSIGDELDDINTSLSSIDQQIQEVKVQTRKSSEQYEKYKSKNAILSPEAQAEVLIQEKALVDQKLLEYQHKLSLVSQLIASSKKRSNIDTMAPGLAELGDEVTAGFIGKLQELQSEESALKQEFTDAYPKLKIVRQQIRNLRTKVRASLKNLRKIFTGEISMLKKEKQRYLARLKEGPRLETDLAPLTRDYKLYETMYTYLLQKRSSLELKRAEALSRFRTIDPIYTNPRPAKPNKALIAIVGLITSLFLAIFLVFFREFLRGDKA